MGFSDTMPVKLSPDPDIGDGQQRGQQTLVGQDERSSVQFPTIPAWALLCADIVVTLDSQYNVYQPGYLVIREGQLIEVGPQSALNEQRFDLGEVNTVNLEGRLVMPGLVDAHTHTPMVLFRGVAEGHSLLTFEGWYDGIRVWEEVMDADMVPPAVAVSCAEMIRTGTTCFADQYFYIDCIVPAVRQSGMRAALAYGIVEMGNQTARERHCVARPSRVTSNGHRHQLGDLRPGDFSRCRCAPARPRVAGHQPRNHRRDGRPAPGPRPGPRRHAVHHPASTGRGG